MPILIGTEQKADTYTTGSQGEAQITALERRTERRIREVPGWGDL